MSHVERIVVAPGHQVQVEDLLLTISV